MTEERAPTPAGMKPAVALTREPSVALSLSAGGPALESTCPSPVRRKHSRGCSFSRGEFCAYCVCLHESSQQPHEEVLLLTPFYQGGNQGTERLSGFPKVTQPVWAEQGLRLNLWDCEAYFGTTELEPRLSLGQR